MTDSLRDRFAAVAPADGRADWADVRRRARGPHVRLPIALAAALGALIVAAPAVALVELLKPEAEPPVVGSIWIQIVPWGSTTLVATISGEVYDQRVRTMELAMNARPRRHRPVADGRFLFRLSKRDFGRCGKLFALDGAGSRIGVIPVPRIPRKPLKPPPPDATVFVHPAPPPRC